MSKYLRIFLMGLVFIVFAGCEGSSSVMEDVPPPAAEGDALIRPADREMAPNLEFVTFKGKSFNIKEHRGKPVVLNFWASWCGPCRLEARVFEQAYRKYSVSGGVVFAGVAVTDREEAARNFVKEFSISYPNGIDDTGRIAGVYGIYAIPQTFILDKKGRIASVYVGAIVEDDIFVDVLGRLIKE